MTNAALQDLVTKLAQLQKDGQLPYQLTRSQVEAIQRSIARNAADASVKLTDAELTAIQDRVNTALLSIGNPQESPAGAMRGFNPATARNSIEQLLKDFGAQALMDSGRLDFALEVGADVMRGAGRYLTQNLSPDVVDEYPALELLRVYDRDVPRGFKRGPKGGLIPVPDDDWPSRWRAAAEESGDDDAAQVLQDTGRMVALKSSGIWQALGDGAGGHDDTLGNAFPPFAFNSGFDVNDITRAEAEQLGLLDPGEKAEGAAIDLTKLFSPIEVTA